MPEAGDSMWLAVLSCLFWKESVEVDTYYAALEGQRYGNVSEKMTGMDFLECSLSCLKHKESRPCHAFNFREADGSCQLIRNNKSHTLNAEGFQAYVQFLCLTDYPKIQNAEEAFHGWSGAHPVPQGGQVEFNCSHPRGFTDGRKVHTATCASIRPDEWCTTFANKRNLVLCPPPRFTDGSFEHNATCSFRPDDAWDSSFQDKDVRCPPAVYPECRMSEKAMEYIGTTNVTETGKSCLRWDSGNVTSSYQSANAGFNKVLFFEEHFLNQDPSLHKNFCRNPTALARPWCFVDDNGLKVEFCWIRLCDDFSEKFHQHRLDSGNAGLRINSTSAPECKLSQKGGEYAGLKDKTISGFDCIPWLDRDSGDVDRIREARKGSFSDEVTDRHSFCRNPNGNPGGPWCNIKDPRKPKLKWEYCDVSFCDFGVSRRILESGDQYKSKRKKP
ncbi:unnamed protein product [Darwinula stevensoni]|uniref:Uncharacterized protein n=1 Tax=Darwinula stevensoni TaxID=69355 RepID=A0A7R9A3R4_9CRUS|nr:unnamed protein product [Darwinula stevensoni]CAG0882691.1 unnamed protein product [Darwinula stevensoni]